MQWDRIQIWRATVIGRGREYHRELAAAGPTAAIGAFSVTLNDLIQ